MCCRICLQAVGDDEIEVLLAAEATRKALHIRPIITGFEVINRRHIFNLSLEFGGISWKLQKYYSDFAELRDLIKASETLEEEILMMQGAGNEDPEMFSKIVNGLPGKHSSAFALKLKMSSAKGKERKQASFMEDRKTKLDAWVASICSALPSEAICDEPFLDEFFEAFWHINRK